MEAILFRAIYQVMTYDLQVNFFVELIEDF